MWGRKPRWGWRCLITLLLGQMVLWSFTLKSRPLLWRTLWAYSKMLLFPCLASEDFLSCLYCENLLELLVFKRKKVWGTFKTGPLVCNSFAHPHSASRNMSKLPSTCFYLLQTPVASASYKLISAVIFCTWPCLQISRQQFALWP